MSETFEGKKLIVLGGTSGIGLAVARRVLAGGGSAVVIGHRQARIEAAIAALASHGDVVALRADLADAAGLQRLQASLAQDHADAGLLVNAAGVFEPKPFLEHTPRDYDLYADLNRATFFLTQGVARRIVASGGSGAIVNIGSMWARQAIKATPSSAYSMAKAGLHSLTQHLAMELAPHRIRVNAVSPAVVETTIYERFIPKAEVHETLQGFNDFHPIGRVGQARDVADVVAFLLSERAGWVTGAVWDVDGGTGHSKTVTLKLQ